MGGWWTVTAGPTVLVCLDPTAVLMDRSPDPPAAGTTGDLQAEGLRGFEIDHQLELGRLLHGQVGGPGAFEDPVDVAGGPSTQVGEVRPVRYQAPTSMCSR
jgi:hypothetical protein